MRDASRRNQARPGRFANIKSGQAVPILSAEAIFDLVFPGHASLAQTYAEYVCGALGDNEHMPGMPAFLKEDMPGMAQFFKLRRQREALLQRMDYTHDDLRADFCSFIKEFIFDYAQAQKVDPSLLDEAEAQINDKTVTEFAAILQYPRLDGNQDDPLQVLANLPFRILLTTSPYRFLEAALVNAGKTPRTIMIRWCQDLRNLEKASIPEVPEGRDPKDFPLVCHLFGLDTNSSSLVLTEDDYLNFLRDVSLARGDDKRDSVPSDVRKALSSDLLILGFSLKSWAFRVLYAGLIKSEDSGRGNRGICVQLPPNEDERDYLHDYLQREALFDVDWNDLSQYVRDLPKP